MEGPLKLNPLQVVASITEAASKVVAGPPEAEVGTLVELLEVLVQQQVQEEVLSLKIFFLSQKT